MDIKKTSEEWEKLTPKEWSLTILDPDGWDRSNYQYSFHEELITKFEFMGKLMYSTIQCNGKAMSEIRWED